MAFLRIARAQDVGVLRERRRCRGQLASAGQPAGKSRRRRRASNVADEHRDFRCSPTSPRTTSATCRRSGLDRTHRQRVRHDAADGALPRAFFQLVRHANARAAAAALRFTVDSGNLAGHLFTLRAGLARAARRADLARALRWTVLATRYRRCSARSDGDAGAGAWAPSRRCVAQLGNGEAPLHARGGAWLPATHRDGGRRVQYATVELDRQPEARTWLEAMQRHCRDALDDIDLVAPWSSAPAPGTLRERRRSSRLFPRCARSQSLDPDDGTARRDVDRVRRDRGRSASRSLTFVEQLRQACRPRSASAWPTIDSLALQTSTRSRRSNTNSCTTNARHLMSIGYNVTEHRATRATTICSRRKRACAASSASPRADCRRRAGSRWGGLLTHAGGEPILLSWSGSMFEYLMPLLVMPTFPNTLLDQTAQRSGEAADPVRQPSAACRGASRNAATTPSTRRSTTSTAHSACRVLACSAGSPRTS